MTLKRPLQQRRRAFATVAVGALVAVTVSAWTFAPAAGADDISDKKAEAQQIAGQIYDLNLKIEEYAEAANAAQVQLNQLNVQIATAQARVNQAIAEEGVHRAELKTYAVDAYVHGQPPKQVDVHIDPNGLVVDPRNSYLQAAADNRQQLIDDLHHAEANLKTQLASLADAKRAAQSQADDLQQKQAETQKAADQLATVKGRIDGELNALVQQAADEQAAAEREAAKREAEKGALAPPSGDPSSTPLPAPPSSSGSGSSSTDPADNPPVTIYIPTRPIPPGPVPPPDTDGAKKAIDYAKAQLGKPYIWGAAGPDAFDCSGLTMQAWKAGGVSMDHWTGSQYAQSRPIPLTEVQPGDLIFYNQFQHVALYIGNGKIIHAPHAGGVVEIEDMYYWRTNMGATRPGVPTS